MRLLPFILLFAIACSSEPGSDEHPDPTPPSNEITNVNRIVEPLSNCTPPLQVTRTLKNIVVTYAAPAGTCPQIWSTLHDPFAWKQGMPFLNELGAMSVPEGPCQRTRRVWNAAWCQQYESWICPNAVRYESTMDALTADWKRTRIQVQAYYTDGTCERQLIADFNQ